MPTIDLGSVIGPQGEQGIQGIQGEPGVAGAAGPNQITSSTSTTLNGILMGSNGAVGVRSVDSTPTNLSTNLVSSGGVATAINTLQSKIANPNLIDNWYFVGGGGDNAFPIKQRNGTTKTGTGYLVDRWRATNDYTTVTVNSDGLYVSATSGNQAIVRQYINDIIDNLRGKTVTLTALTDTGLYSATTTIPTTDPASNTGYANSANICSVYYQTGNVGWYIRLSTATSGSNIYYAIKLEIGDTQTLCYEDGNGNYVLNEIPNYTEQLLRCCRYYLRLSGLVRYPLTRYVASTRNLDFCIPIPVRFAKTPAIENDSLISVAAGANAASGTYNFEVTDNSWNAISIRATGASGVTVPSVSDGISLLITSGAAITAEP